MIIWNDTELYRVLLAMSIGAFMMAAWSVIKVHITDHPIYLKIRTARNLLVLTYFVVICFNTAELFYILQKDILDSLFVVSGMFESLFMVFFLISLINPSLLRLRWLLLHVAVNCSLLLLNIITVVNYPVYFRPVIYATIAVYSVQLVFYFYYFFRVYHITLKSLTEYYEEDEEIHIKWVRNSFIGVFCIGILNAASVLSNYMLYSCFIICYVIVYSYIAVGFINRYYKYSKIIPTVIKITGKEGTANNKTNNEQPQTRTFQYYDKRRLALSMDLWISDKGYLVPNVPMEEILKILDTTRPVLKAFMQDIYGMDFQNWRNEMRLEYAYNLLTLHLENSIENVAKKSGFSDTRYFTHTFIEKYNVHPRSLLNNKDRIVQDA